jgi:ribonuclease HII
MLNLETESKYFKLGYKLIAGVDEAGRGPLAGPVVAAAVVIDSNFKINHDDLELVNDSKKLSAKNREKLFGLIKKNVLAVEIGVVDNLTIDKINILQASFLAMRRAIKKLKLEPDHVLVDGNFKIPKLNDTTRLTLVANRFKFDDDKSYLIKIPNKINTKIFRDLSETTHFGANVSFAKCIILNQNFLNLKNLSNQLINRFKNN